MHEDKVGELEPSWSGVVPSLSGPEIDARERARLRETIEAYEREIAASVDPRRRAALSHEVGRIHEDAFGDERQAIRDYQRAFRADPTHLPTLVAVRRLFGRAGKWAMVSRVLEAELKVRTRPADRARLLCEQGDLYLLRFHDAEGARQAFAAAVSLDPECVRAQAGLVRASGLEGRSSEAGAALLALARWADDGAQAASIRLQAAVALMAAAPDEAARIARAAVAQLDERAAAGWGGGPAAGVAEAPLARAGLLVEAARRCRLTDPQQARSLLEQATGLAPEDGFAWDCLADVEQRSGRWEAVAVALERGCAAADGPVQRVERLWRLADLRLVHLDDVDGAVDALQGLLELDPLWPAAVERLERLLTSQGDWEAVAEVRLRQVEALTDPHGQADAWFRLGLLFEAHLADPVRAAEAYRQAVAARPDFQDASKALGRLLLAQGDWAGYAALLEAEAARTEGVAARVRLLVRVAEIAEERLEDPEWSLRVCGEVLALEPGHGPVMARTGRLLAHLGRWAELLGINERELERAAQLGHRLTLLVRSAEICARELGDVQRALHYVDRCLALAPRYAPAVELATVVYQQEGDWVGLVGLLRRQMAVARDGAQRARLAFRVGELLRDRLGDPGGALAAFEEVRAAGVGDPPTWLALAGLYAQAGDAEREIELLTQAAEAIEVPSERAPVWFRVGCRCEQRGAFDAAQDAWERAVALDPTHRPSVAALLGLLEQRGDLEGALALRRQLAASAASPAEAVLHWRAVGLARLDAGLAPEAIEAFEAVAALIPSDPGTLLVLERLYLSVEAYGALEGVYGRLAEALPEGALRAEYLARRGRLRLDVLRDRPGAIADFMAVLAWRPDDGEALARIERHAASTGDVAMLAAILEPRLASAGSDKERVLILERAGDALWRAGRLGDAVRCYEAVLAIEADSIIALRALRGLYRELGEAEASATVTEAEGRHALDPHNAARLWVEAGATRELSRRDARAALADYRAALDRDPRDAVALAAVRRICERTGRWGELAEQLEVLAEAPGADRVSLWREAAQIHARRLDDFAAAERILARVAAVPEAPPDAWQQLADLRVEAEDWAGAVAAYGEVSQRAEDPELARAVAARVAAICEGKLGDPVAALPWLERAVGPCPEPEDALRVARLAELAGEPERARAALARCLEAGSWDLERLDPVREALARLSLDPREQLRLLGQLVRPAAPLEAGLRWVEAARACGEHSDLLEVLGRWADGARGVASKGLRRLLVAESRSAGVPAARIGRHIEALIDADPDDVSLRRLHLESLSPEVGPERIIAALRWLLSRDPFSTPDLLQLRRIFERMGAADHAAELARLRIVLGDGAAHDEELVDTQASFTRRWPVRPLDESDRGLVWEGSVIALAEALAAIGAAVPEVLSWPGALGDPIHGALPDRAREVARILGVDVGAVVLDGRAVDEVERVGSTLWVGHELAACSAAEQAFWLGVGLERAYQGLSWLGRWTPAALEERLGLLVEARQAGAQAELRLRLGGRLEGISGPIEVVAGRMARGELAAGLADITTATHRIGLLVGGISPAMTAVARRAKVRLTVEPSFDLSQAPQLAALARWVVGEPYARLRRRLGLARS